MNKMNKKEHLKRIEVSKRFKIWRLENNLTQKKIATGLNLSENYISDVETYKSGFSQRSLQKLHMDFDLDINWLLSGTK